ncbi:unnamed protein product [Adineta steineri]|uniref:PiggyBac transposable element-derived protein domain-containing protein n=1 Tax=Adineta steineri TaxID=433720 RepID=A0A815GLB6_9BILA|nr:unnamed protein product [Adineta steineri]
MSSEEASTEDSPDSLSEVRVLDDDFARMHFESASSDEEVTDDEVDSNVWSEFLEDYGLIEQVTLTSEDGKQNPTTGVSHTKTVIMQLLEDLFGCYRTVVADNFFTSIDLAKRLLGNDTYLIETMRSNRVGSGKAILQKKLKGEIYGLQNGDGVKLIKWTSEKLIHLASAS